MRYTWELGAADTVTLVKQPLGKRVVALNGEEKGTLTARKPVIFTLSDGREVKVEWIRPFVGTQFPKLFVDGELARVTTKASYVCPQCSASVRPYDRHCDSCGHELPTAQDQEAEQLVGRARATIGGLSILFVLSGVIMFVLTLGQAKGALRDLEGLPPDMPLEPIDGEVYTVAELRSLIEWEPYSVLIVNLVLAAVMLALYFWAKRASFAAIIVAAAVYAAVIVLNAIIDPTTIGQGIVIKIIVVLFLARGIQSELHLRARAG